MVPKGGCAGTHGGTDQAGLLVRAGPRNSEGRRYLICLDQGSGDRRGPSRRGNAAHNGEDPECRATRGGARASSQAASARGTAFGEELSAVNRGVAHSSRQQVATWKRLGRKWRQREAFCRHFVGDSLLYLSSPLASPCAMVFTIVPLASSSFSAQTSAPPKPRKSMYSIFKNIVNGFS